MVEEVRRITCLFQALSHETCQVGKNLKGGGGLSEFFQPENKTVLVRG